ncbi:MAG TPA: glycoside hydrolase family 15 protein [Anaeromyxobacteraceae bacterium]|nr:glycoside hydrolase family 15 protein [Anaeromyxobacteraceae bacterium]
MRLEDLGLIGNCQFAALVGRDGSVVWCCLPRLDSEPVFGALLDEAHGGRFRVGPASGAVGTQRYLPNTNVLETLFEDAEGAFRVLDFAPRFEQYHRTFHPSQLVRVVEPVRGMPRIRVTCEPRVGWSRAEPVVLTGSNHVRFEGFPSELRLTTDVPVSYLGGQPFALARRRHLVLSWGEPPEEALDAVCDRFLSETKRHWRLWVKRCAIPPMYQGPVIRSALTLKLHCFEDTGAIVAATTTSLPESPSGGRTWDYRYCWLRDASYVLAALRWLGQFEECEHFLNFLFDVTSGSPGLDLAPIYRIDGRSDLDERVLPDWPGFRGLGPVRVGNGAARQHQHDIFGEAALALAPIFLDARFAEEQTEETLELLERLAMKAVSVAGSPDFGIWEARTAPTVQTFSSLMSWAAADRVSSVLERARPVRSRELRSAATRIHAEILERAWSVERGSFVAAYGGSELDAALLQMCPLRFLPPDDGRLSATVAAVVGDLCCDGWLRRYRTDDGLGKPQVAFVLCTFWWVEALATLGRSEEARTVLERALGALSPLGLLSEDFDPGEGLWGNYPQAYSHVGLINAAFQASPPWGRFP